MSVTRVAPDGLVLQSREVGQEKKRRVWDIRHVDTGLHVVTDCRNRAEAEEVAEALTGFDWTRPVDEIRADPAARAVAMALQQEVQQARSRR